MIRLVPLTIYDQVRSRAKRFDWRGILPQHNTIALTIACRQRAANDWSVWVVEPFTTGNRFANWLSGHKPTFPTWQPDLSGERTIIWNNAGVQRGLAVQEAFVQPGRYRFDSLAGLEIVAYSVAHDLCRVWFIDWQIPLQPGVDPRTLTAGQRSSPFTSRDKALAEALRASYQTMAGKRQVITKEAISYADRR